MKRVRNLLVLCIVAAMALCLFAGCESTADKIEKLSGTWYMVTDDTEEQALILLENIDLYEEEIALVDLTQLDYVKTVTFSTLKTYQFACDPEGTKECVREFYTYVFETMYENRASLTSLNETYGVSLEQLTKDEFMTFYASMYGADGYHAMIDLFTENAYDYASLAEPLETGTFTIKGSDIMCTITGESQAEALGYKISDNTLTLTYINGTEVYTR